VPIQEKTDHPAVNAQRIQEVLSDLLRLSIGKYPFPRLMQEFLALLVSFPWLEVLPKGALFLVDENDPANLVLTAHHNIAKPTLIKCARLPFGRCLCGKAALSKEIIFVDQIDEQHENCCDNMSPHGHYCIPIKSVDDSILGVFTLYTQNGAQRSPEVEAILQTAAAAVAGMIRLHLCEITSKESEKSYLAITNAAADAIIMMDNRGLITFWNPAAEKVFGFPAVEALGKGLHDIIVPQNYASAYKSALRKFFKTGEGGLFGQTIEVNGKHKDGHEIPLELSLSRLQIKNKWHAIGIIRNITARKLVEQEKEKLNQHLQQAHRLEAIGTLAGGIAHDFNNITASILGFAEILQNEPTFGSQAREDLGHIISAANRGKDITRQLLTFSRKTDQKKSPIQIQPLLKETVKLIRASIPANIEIHTNITATSANILASPTQIHQIIINLCTNAHHAIGAQNGIIDINLEIIEKQNNTEETPTLNTGDYIRLTVSDTGTGIAPDTLEHIFEPFFTTSPQGEGTGLGLSITHGIVSDLNGIIQVKSNLGLGTLFEIFIPICQAENTNPIPANLAPPATGSGSILIVEDEPSLAEITARSLKKIGYDTVVRLDGCEALQDFKRQPERFDLILTDQIMPQMTGTKMAAEILKFRPEIPIIIMTGTLDKSLLEKAQRIGVKKVIIKPLSINELNSAIKELLDLNT
jgi:PAS domain S-box-containing protein